MNPELIIILVLLVALYATHQLSRRALKTRPTRTAANRNRARTPNRARNRRSKPRKHTPGPFAGSVTLSHTSKCAHCRGPILRGEFAYPTRRGLLGPCCTVGR